MGRQLVLTACAVGLILNGFALLRIAFPDLIWDTNDTKVTDWALVLLTAAYVLVSGLQFVAMSRTVAAMQESTRVAMKALDHARDTAKSTLEETRRTSGLTLRAYVGMQEATIESVEDEDRTYWLHIIIKNVGLTPAVKVDCLGATEVAPFPDLGNYGRATHPGARGVLLPGCTLSQNLSRTLTLEEVASIQTTAHTLFAYGEIRYVDFFGTERVTTYRVMAQPEDLRRGLEKTPMIVCRDGNSLT